jgi:CheY-like chemotaxis protein
MLFAKHISAQFTPIDSARVDAAVIDLKMPGMHGLELADLRQQINSLREDAMTKTMG